MEYVNLPHSCLSLGPFSCQLSRNLVCYTCFPSRIQGILPQWPESTTNWLLGSFNHVTSRYPWRVSTVCCIDGTCQTPTIRKQPQTHTRTHARTHTHTNLLIKNYLCKNYVTSPFICFLCLHNKIIK